MKKINILLLGLSLFCFTSCFDITEEFTLNADGSGEYSMTMDMYRMIEMMSSMAGEKGLKGNKDYDQVMDSSFSFKPIIDTAKNLSDEQRLLFREAGFNMRMHLKEKQSYMRFRFPFTRPDNLAKLYAEAPLAMDIVGSKKPEINDAAASKPGRSSVMPQSGAARDITRSNAYYTIRHDRNHFEKRIDTTAFKAYLEKDSMLVQMAPMLQEAKMVTVIHLPRPAAKVDGKAASLSKDRKTLTLTCTFEEYFLHPELMDVKVEY
jgi:hypothetical protein